MIKGKHHSKYITPQQAATIKNHIKSFETQGIAPNHAMVLDLERALPEDIVNKQPLQEILSPFLNHMRRWHQRHRRSFCYLWVLENSGSVGVHVHILIYTPDENYDDFNRFLANALPFDRDDLSGNKHSNFHTQPIDDLWGKVDYILKGLDKREPQLSHHSQGYQGYIIGKRWGFSHRPLIY